MQIRVIRGKRDHLRCTRFRSKNKMNFDLHPFKKEWMQTQTETVTALRIE
jgi:hypothetical protein